MDNYDSFEDAIFPFMKAEPAVGKTGRHGGPAWRVQDSNYDPEGHLVYPTGLGREDVNDEKRGGKKIHPSRVSQLVGTELRNMGHNNHRDLANPKNMHPKDRVAFANIAQTRSDPFKSSLNPYHNPRDPRHNKTYEMVDKLAKQISARHKNGNMVKKSMDNESKQNAQDMAAEHTKKVVKRDQRVNDEIKDINSNRGTNYPTRPIDAKQTFKQNSSEYRKLAKAVDDPFEQLIRPFMKSSKEQAERAAEYTKRILSDKDDPRAPRDPKKEYKTQDRIERVREPGNDPDGAKQSNMFKMGKVARKIRPDIKPEHIPKQTSLLEDSIINYFRASDKQVQDAAKSTKTRLSNQYGAKPDAKKIYQGEERLRRAGDKAKAGNKGPIKNLGIQLANESGEHYDKPKEVRKSEDSIIIDGELYIRATDEQAKWAANKTKKDMVVLKQMKGDSMPPALVQKLAKRQYKFNDSMKRSHDKNPLYHRLIRNINFNSED